MTDSEYHDRYRKLKVDFDAQVLGLQREYAKSLPGVIPVGGFAKDTSGRNIKVTSRKIGTGISSGPNGMPQMVYYGPLLKRDGTPYKGKEVAILHSDLVPVGKEA